MPGDRERILAAGATGYLEKPINPETFVSQIREYLPPQLRDDRRTPQ
jgi:CheY-like chemotaxis protein